MYSTIGVRRLGYYITSTGITFNKRFSKPIIEELPYLLVLDFEY